jgi:hypothetical protein
MWTEPSLLSQSVPLYPRPIMATGCSLNQASSVTGPRGARPCPLDLLPSCLPPGPDCAATQRADFLSWGSPARTWGDFLRQQPRECSSPLARIFLIRLWSPYDAVSVTTEIFLVTLLGKSQVLSSPHLTCIVSSLPFCDDILSPCDK